MIDNSGIEFFYTSTRRQYDAGILTVGHHVNRQMIIPPNTESYSIVGECSADCTNAVHNSSIILQIAAVAVVLSRRNMPGYKLRNTAASSHFVLSA